MATDPRNGMVILEPAECWERMAGEQFGRLAVAVAGRPDIFPINYVVFEKSIFIRTAEGSKLASMAVNQVVAFEIDGYEEDTHNAWSVVAHGVAHLVGHDELERIAETLPLFPWNTAPKNRFVQIVVKDVSGRHFFADGHP